MVFSLAAVIQVVKKHSFPLKGTQSRTTHASFFKFVVCNLSYSKAPKSVTTIN